MPTHAWFTAFAPYGDPEIVVTVFIANGGEGSANAVPVAKKVLEAYFAAEGRWLRAGLRIGVPMRSVLWRRFDWILLALVLLLSGYGHPDDRQRAVG